MIVIYIMPNFKPKANKKIKINKKSTITLDSKHNEKMQEFNDIQYKIIPDLLKRKKLLRKNLKITTNIENNIVIFGKRYRSVIDPMIAIKITNTLF